MPAPAPTYGPNATDEIEVACPSCDYDEAQSTPRGQRPCDCCDDTGSVSIRHALTCATCRFQPHVWDLIRDAIYDLAVAPATAPQTAPAPAPATGVAGAAVFLPAAGSPARPSAAATRTLLQVEQALAVLPVPDYAQQWAQVRPATGPWAQVRPATGPFDRALAAIPRTLPTVGRVIPFGGGAQ